MFYCLPQLGPTNAEALIAMTFSTFGWALIGIITMSYSESDNELDLVPTVLLSHHVNTRLERLV